MNQDSLRFGQGQIQRRLDELLNCPPPQFIQHCSQFVSWARNSPLLRGLLLSLENQSTNDTTAIEKIFNEDIADGSSIYLNKVRLTEFYSASTLEEHSVATWAAICGLAKLQSARGDKPNYAVSALNDFFSGSSSLSEWQDRVDQFPDSIQGFRSSCVEKLFGFLSEKIESQSCVYSILLRYKQRSEWFHRKRLQEIADGGWQGQKKGERALAMDLQSYLLDQGAAFWVEPTSDSGEVDLILKSNEHVYIPADAKYIFQKDSESAVVKQIAAGFNQVSRYCRDYGVLSGYLIVFNRSLKKLQLEIEIENGLPFLEIENKKIYYIAVNIADLATASKEGKAKQISISTSALIEQIGD